ncbi:hypothetical protein MPER_06603 [Moniliophthora perniciosa FA553]|nr:hypothetical protein MPER_06603 [Moniliophthora perniciosa FA553]
MDDELDERKQYTTFEQYQDFSNTQDLFLKSNIYAEPTPEEQREESAQYTKLTNTLYSYQEQSYLLDPFLERLVTPVVERLKSHAKETVVDRTLRPSQTRMMRLAMLLYSYIKFRGYKTIIRFFPHEVADLGVAVGYMQLPDGFIHEPSQWTLRYVLLLWLSLICMIPFDLAQFDEDEKGQTAKVIEEIAKRYLGKAGLEREGAAILLSRLYMRQDTAYQFDAFLGWGQTTILDTTDPLITTGILQVLAETLKSGPGTIVNSSVSHYWPLNAAFDAHQNLLTNTVVRKYKSKISSRVGLRLLPGNTRSRMRGRHLNGNTSAQVPQPENDIDVPEEEEAIWDNS